jgi:hypothetical protein
MNTKDIKKSGPAIGKLSLKSTKLKSPRMIRNRVKLKNSNKYRY